MIKVFVSDLDQTLLNEAHQLPQETRALIKRIREAGYLFGVATGRPKIGTASAIEDLSEVVDFAIYDNGGMIDNFREGTTIKQHFLDGETVREIVTIGRSLGGNPTISSGEHMITDNGDRFKQPGRTQPDNFIIDDVLNYVGDAHPKVVFIGDDDLMNDIGQYFADHPSDKYRAFKSGTSILEVMDPRVNKLMGIKWALEHFGLTEENLMTFGDNDNDVEMLKGAKIGVAVKNATDQAKAVADIIIEANTDNGVYQYLSQYIDEQLTK